MFTQHKFKYFILRAPDTGADGQPPEQPDEQPTEVHTEREVELTNRISDLEKEIDELKKTNHKLFIRATAKDTDEEEMSEDDKLDAQLLEVLKNGGVF